MLTSWDAGGETGAIRFVRMGMRRKLRNGQRRARIGHTAYRKGERLRRGGDWSTKCPEARVGPRPPGLDLAKGAPRGPGVCMTSEGRRPKSDSRGGAAAVPTHASGTRVGGVRRT